MISIMNILGSVKDLFLYNRQNFGFNRGIELERVYQVQKMRIEQVELYREDIRDLFELTISKMDSYLIVNTLSLAFTMGFFYEGRLPENTPAWLMWLWALTLLSAMVYLLLSVWFALHAVVTAQTFAVRILTQWLRLPIPSPADIRAAAPRLEDFERGAVREILRLPVLSPGEKTESAGSFSLTGAAAASARVRRNLETQYTDFVEHFQLFRNLQVNWTGFDAYARVTMVLGTFNILYLIGYFAMAHFLFALKQLGSISFLVGMFAFSALHARHNFVLSPRAHLLVVFILALGPAISTAAAVLAMENRTSTVTAWLAPFSFAAHAMIALFFLYQGYESAGTLPTGFTTVVSIDLLGPEEPLQNDDEDIVGEKTRPASSVFSPQRKPEGQTNGKINPSSRLPWDIFKIAGGLVVFVWLAGFAVALANAVGVSIWRWENDPQPYSRMAFYHWRYSTTA